uniref:Protein DEK n=1 Tax=Anthurium amnicola TaxID=1678845 RepID=A0A1D1Y7F9_9ARAE
MSGPDKPTVAEVVTATCGTGAHEDTGGEGIAEKSEEKENVSKAVDGQNDENIEKKEEDVKMEDTADEKGIVDKQTKLGKEVEEEKPTKEEVEEVESKGQKDGEAAEQNGEEAVEKGEGAEEKGGEGEEKPGEIEEEIRTRKKRVKRPSSLEVGEKDDKTKKKKGRAAKEVLSTPLASPIDRPVRERKTVERLVETLRKEPSKALLIEKGQGTPLKDIPNVAYKLSKRKPADIKSLHLLLFGRKGKAINYKNHIFQFSGFVWHENEDKQRTKLKEKLDKCVKDRLLDFCDVFDIPGSRATSRKEELVAKLLDFMVSPRATTDVILADKEQLLKSRKRRRVSRSALRRYAGISGKQSRKKRTKGENASKSEKSAIETEDEDEEEEGDKENGLPDEDETVKHSETEEEDESEQDNTAKEVEYSEKVRQVTKKSSRKGRSPVMAKSKKLTTPKKTPLPASNKSPRKPYSKRLKADKAKNSKDEVFSRKKKHEVTPKKTMPSSNADVEDKKATGKKAGRSKAKSNQAKESGPTEDELRNTICEILKEVDFNTATFTDILKKLASHYNMDLTARKGSIKLMIQDELTKLADEAEDEDDSEDEGDAEKVENLEPEGKEVEA